MALELCESFVDATRGVRFGDSEWTRAYTDDRGELYRSLVAEYGRCVGKVYVDRRVPVCGDALQPACENVVVPVGWVFHKRMEYEDAHRLRRGECKTYLREVWVTVREVEEVEE